MLNQDYVYGYVMDTAGNIVNAYSSYTNPEFRRPNANLSWTPQTAPAQNLVQNPMWYNTNFAVVPSNEVNLDVTNYNVTDTPAAPGDTAEIALSGAALSPLPNSIQWTDSAGNVVKTCDNITSYADAAACSLPVPADAKDGKIYRATLYSGGNAVASDSFVVKKAQPQATTNDPVITAIDDQSVPVGTGITPVTVKTDDPKATVTVDGLPDGVTFDPDNGTITGAPKDAGTYPVTVTVTDEAGNKSTETFTITATTPADNTTDGGNQQPAPGGTTGNGDGSVTIPADNNAGTGEAPAAPVDSAPEADSGSLAYTGANGVALLAGLGVLALALGGVLLAARRRKNS